METALSEITLVLFTTIAPAGVVGYLVMAAGILRAPSDAEAARIGRCLVVPLVLSITGLIASATHLGTPANALYVLTGIGRSPLSNEVVAAVAFLALGGVYWIVSFRDDVPRAFRTAWLAVTMAAGVAFVLFISLAYSVDTVPTWSLPTAPVTLWLNALSSGPLVGLLGLRTAGSGRSRAFWATCLGTVAVATAANAAVLAKEHEWLAGIATTVQTALDLAPWFLQTAVVFVACQAVAVTAAALACRGERADALSAAAAPREGGSANGGAAAGGVSSVAHGAPDAGQAPLSPDALVRPAWATRCTVALAGAAVVSMAGCFAVRFAFYAVHMTSGM